MTLDEVVHCRELRNLPFKIETNGIGEVVMSPAYNPHADCQSIIFRLLLRMLPRWKMRVKCPVQTSDGVKAPDVAAISPERFQVVRRQRIYKTAPDICVEFRSPSNANVEMVDKRRMYFERDARECGSSTPSERLPFTGRRDGENVRRSARSSPPWCRKTRRRSRV